MWCVLNPPPRSGSFSRGRDYLLANSLPGSGFLSVFLLASTCGCGFMAFLTAPRAVASFGIVRGRGRLSGAVILCGSLAPGPRRASGYVSLGGHGQRAELWSWWAPSSGRPWGFCVCVWGAGCLHGCVFLRWPLSVPASVFCRLQPLEVPSECGRNPFLRCVSGVEVPLGALLGGWSRLLWVWLGGQGLCLIHYCVP